MRKYILRLDDACEKRNIQSWNVIESLCDEFSVRPLVGVIPECRDPKMQLFDIDNNFWRQRIHKWIEKGWTIALHGYDHCYITECGGLHPVNNKSEFAGVSLDIQKDKIASGVSILSKNGIEPKVFFAPSHTFDENTLIALKAESDIRIISDTIATDSYYVDGFTFVPQQFSYLRPSPYKISTYCLHPNTMTKEAIKGMELFFKQYHDKFVPFPLEQSSRKFSIIDEWARQYYFRKRGISLKE